MEDDPEVGEATPLLKRRSMPSYRSRQRAQNATWSPFTTSQQQQQQQLDVWTPMPLAELLPKWTGHCAAMQLLLPDLETGRCFCVHVPQEPCDDQGKPPPPQLLKYNAQLTASILCLLHIRRTVFASWSIWLHVLCNVTIASLVCVLMFFSCRRPELIDTARVSEIVKYSSALVGFLLVFHLTAAVRRWWAMRIETLGGFWNAVSDVAMILAAHLPERDHRDLKALVLRYCLASLELTFMQAHGTDGVLGDLVKQSLLTHDEKRRLEELVSKPQAMWVWIAGLFQHLTERGRLSSRLLVALYDICARARASVGRGRGAFAYLDTQLPFSYLHLLSVLVHINNLILAAKCGALAAVGIRNLLRSEKKEPVSDAENIQVVLLQVVFVTCVPAWYHAMLEAAAGLGDPFGDRFQDFPRRACHIWMRDECEAFHAAGEQLPDEALKIVDEFDVQEEDLVQDKVVIMQPIQG
mmetsp:Transcript_92538/g.160790  ORF Transcript_92538/g.160790 Transcript_92538/m.160790 type:complete len:467 (-) Transcript_92538:54-1454(-)